MKNLKLFSSGKPEIIFPGWLLFFRINIAVLSIFHFASIQRDFGDFYSFNGYAYPDIQDASYDHYSFTIISLNAFLHKTGIILQYDTLLSVCRYCYPLFLGLLLVGLFTRLSAMLSLFFQLLMIKSIHMYTYGVDFFTTIALFYCCIFPVGKVLSIDNIIFKTRKPVDHKIYLNLLKTHLSIAYFFSGIDKIIGESWRNGEAIWKTLHAHNYYSIFKLDFLADTPFFIISGWVTIIIEMLYPVFMNVKKTRPFWLIAVIGLHLFIAFFMGLFFFSAIMIILSIAAYYMPYHNFEKAIKVEGVLAGPGSSSQNEITGIGN